MADPCSHPLSLFFGARPPATVVLEDFQILRKIGSGTMGAVYLAHQVSLNRDVALKVLAQALVEKRSFVERFSREASVLSSLDHPNIVRLFGIGSEHGCYYYAMEYVNGFTLRTLREGLGGRMSAGDALYIALKCAAGLGHAHARRIVHRDVKPENIMIDRLGEVRITDLGLAKTIDQDPGLTESGAGVGTPRYMAPEQARGGKHADARSDIYALGCTLYQLLTGTVPFDSDNSADLMLAKDRGFFRPARRFNRDLPPRLDLILDKMLAKDPRLRYQNCDDLTRDLLSLNLARDHLSFNVLQVGRALRPDVSVPDCEHVEVFLVHDDACAIRTIQDALYDSRIPSCLRVVSDGAKALSFLSRRAPYTGVPRPSLILIGLPLTSPDSRKVLIEIRDNETLHPIPVVILSAPPNSSDVLAADGLKASLVMTKPEDLGKLEELIRTVHSLCLTVVERTQAGQSGPEA
jgi:serine/threonine protein kinase